MIANETVNVFYLVLGNSCVNAAGVLDNEGRNPFHCAIDSTTKGLLDYCSNTNATTSSNSSEDVADICMTGYDEDRSVYSISNILNKMLTLKPDLIEQTDGRTGLYPFMQVAACATEYASQNERNNEGASSPKSPDNRMRVSLTFSLYLDFRLRFWTIDYRFRDIQFERRWIFPVLLIFGPLVLARISLPNSIWT